MTAPKKLTHRQQLVLSFIIEHIGEWGYPPTIREIGDHLSIKSTNGVNDHLKALERKGYLERQDSKSRALKPLRTPDGRLIEEGNNPFALSDEGVEAIQRIPVVGRIAAGMPIAAIENTEDFLSLGESMLGRAPSEDVFSLRVRGDSMIEDGIFDGDYIFVQRQQDALNGEIVAAMVDGEATVKRLYHEGSRVRLQPANSAMEPIYVRAEDARETCVLGKVIGVFRKI